ncbi:MAG: NAD-dependent epimerase/dehydratase family protein, partial [Spirochaetia bacterium]
MKVLFIGGSGNISSACTDRALGAGIEVTHLNRGNSPKTEGTQRIICNARDTEALKSALRGKHFDCVVQWICFDPETAEGDLEVFTGIADQYIFISTASAYKKPLGSLPITEGTALANPFWEYSRKKIAAEEVFMQAYREKGFPVTIVRPSHTYNTGWIPTTFGSSDFTVPGRIRDGKRIIVHGDGQSLWTLTHAQDFAKGFTGLLGNELAIGEAVHITSDQALSWDNIHRIIARALGRKADIVHVTSETLAKEFLGYGPGWLGDKRYSLVFDNSKIKQLVPGFACTIPFHT